MITGCFHLFTTQARANALSLKVCLHYDALTSNTAGMIPNPSQISFLRILSTRRARWSVVCGLIWVWINLNKTEKTTTIKVFLELIARK